MEDEEDSAVWESKMCESMVGAWWDVLREKNRLSLESRNVEETAPFAALSQPIVQVVFSIAHILHQPSVVRYTALEIFNRFIRQLFVQLRSYVKTSTSQVSPARQWSRILVRTRNQTLLRIMSCLQLASKLNFSTQALSPAVVQGFLRQLQQPFSRHSIMASERRVLKTINFQFGEPACTFLQHLVGSLQQLAPRPDPALLYSAGLAALDLAFLHIHHVFPYGTATTSPRQRHTLACDYVQLSAAVVVCGLVVLDDYGDGVGLALHRLTDLPMREVEKLAAVILRATQVVPSSPSP